MSADVCANCCYWAPHVRRNAKMHKEDAEGRCRRYAPAPSMFAEETNVALWPTTWSDQWCGDYKPGAQRTERSE